MNKGDYKRLGDYIREVDVRNRDLKVTRLLGLSMTKEFRSSTSNVNGTDLSKYKIVNKGVFAFDTMSVIRVHKVPICLNESDEQIIISPAYITFKVCSDELLTDYLKLYFRNPEFDRYAEYKSDASVRGGYNWNELCETYIPIPSVQEQRKIVDRYKAIQNRIEINKQSISRLEEAAQALYRKMFVDDIDVENLPEGWRMGTLGEIAEFKNGKTTIINNGCFPVYGGNGILGFTDSFNAENTIIIGRVGINCGNINLEMNKCWVNDNAIMAKSNNNMVCYLYWLLSNLHLNEQSEGSGQPLLTQTILNQQECIVPTSEAMKRFNDKVLALHDYNNKLLKENQILKELEKLILAKINLI